MAVQLGLQPQLRRLRQPQRRSQQSTVFWKTMTTPSKTVETASRSDESTTIAVRTSSVTYDVEIGAGLAGLVGERVDSLLAGGIAAGRQRAFVVTSPEIDRLWGAKLECGFPAGIRKLTKLMVPAGEEHKRLATVERLAEELAGHGADRDSVLIAFGGGVIGDMTGFLAAMYMRGIRYVGVPTTLLAQVDSSLGGKTGVNLAAGKNLVGAFHHPLAVYADTAVLETLPAAELRAGLQESVKAGIIRDRGLFEMLERESAAVLGGDRAALTRVVAASVRVKADVVNADEREMGVRMILNLGHTLGHAIEAATGYKQLLHGEAVAWGMIAAVGIALRRGTVSAAEAERMERVIRMYGPMRGFTAEAAELVALTAKDKKNRSGARSFVLPVGIGDAVVVKDVSEAELMVAAAGIVAEAAGIVAEAGGVSA
jgi:3-dehydroquinate synthase